MRQSYFVLLFCIGHFSAFCQWNEAFSDLNFTTNPIWAGDTSFFRISPDSQLQSNGPNATAQLYLSTQNARCHDTEWNFDVNLDFDVTTSNWAKVYLVADRSDTKDFPNGYYVKFDGTNNSIDFYRQDSSTHNKLIAGKNGRVGKTAQNKMSVKVICDGMGNWFLYSDSMATKQNFIREGKVFDTTYKVSTYCGVHFIHTSTRRQKFYFDNFMIDEAPLSLLSAKALSANRILLSFNKELDIFSAETITNFLLSDINLQITSATIDVTHKNCVYIQLADPLNTYTQYSIQTISIKDFENKNIGLLNSAEFSYRLETGYGDLIFTEFLPDPSPIVGLPEVEFIELYNRKADTINCQDFKLTDGTSTSLFPFYKIPPNQYLIVCAQTNVGQFSSYAPVLGLTNFPSLNNTGDHFVLKNQEDVLLHEVSYSDTWYDDNDKKVGGWSLEIIDVNSPCIGKENWTASIHELGGTPTKVNSVSASKPDLTAPVLRSAFIIDSITVQLEFDEKVDTNHISNTQFEFENIIISEVIFSQDNPNVLFVKTNNTFEKGNVYYLSIAGIRDCSGNIMQRLEGLELIMPSEAKVGDIILNEILFNPKSGGYDFVELYNGSDKYIDIKNWLLANVEEEKIENKKLISEAPFILKPKSYVAFTVDKAMLLNHYPMGVEERIFQVKALPAFNDDEGTVVLLDGNGIEQERFAYSESMHAALLDDKEGVSLERIMPFGKVTEDQNWHSASTTVGYATPGYRNSQYKDETKGTAVWVEPKVFTPNQDGHDDFALLHYQFGLPGFMANFTIFDYAGREIKRLVRNELLGQEGFYKWDGADEQGEKVRTGLYIVYVEVFDLNGIVNYYKETVVVGWVE